MAAAVKLDSLTIIPKTYQFLQVILWHKLHKNKKFF